MGDAVLVCACLGFGFSCVLVVSCFFALCRLILWFAVDLGLYIVCCFASVLFCECVIDFVVIAV